MSEDESVRPEHATPPTPEAAPLLVQARGLEMAGRESMVFGPLDFDIPQGNIGVLTGQQGSGRSALLLALSGRLKGVKGHLVINGEDVTRLASMAKLKAGRLVRQVADNCLQYYGGMGFMNETPVSRMFRDTRLASIGGGADEIMLTIISKYMGILPKGH